MPVDTSIYSNVGQGVTPLENPMDAMSKAMAFSSLANRNKLESVQAQQAQQSFNDSQAMRNAMNNNTKVDPDTGAVTRDNAGMFKDLAAGGNTHLVPQVQSQIASMNDAMLKANLEKTTAASQMLQGIEAIKDPAKQQEAYAAMRNSPIAQMAGSANWPEQHDPDFVKGLGQQTMTHTQLLESEAKDRGLNIEQQKADIESKKLGMDVTKNKAEQNQQTLSALQALRGNPALQRAETNVLSAKTMNDLADQSIDPKTGKRDLNNLKPRQINLVDHELIRMATGGSGNEADMNNLKPGTPQYNIAMLHQKITGAQSPAQAGEFVQQALDYANSLSKSSGEFLYQNAKHVVDAKRNYLAPEDQRRYDSWLGDMKNGKAFFGDQVEGGPQAAEPGTTYDHNGETYKIIGNHWVKQTSQARK